MFCNRPFELGKYIFVTSKIYTSTTVSLDTSFKQCLYFDSPYLKIFKWQVMSCNSSVNQDCQGYTHTNYCMFILLKRGKNKNYVTDSGCGSMVQYLSHPGIWVYFPTHKEKWRGRERKNYFNSIFIQYCISYNSPITNFTLEVRPVTY